MPAEERLALIDALWDSLDDGHLKLTDEQLAALQRRRDAAENGLPDFRDWADVKAAMERRMRRCTGSGLARPHTRISNRPWTGMALSVAVCGGNSLPTSIAS
jgi:putative addiction module component (TIGR02574 family)